MKLIIQTVYTNIDQEFVNYWLKVQGPHYGVKASNIEPGEEFTHVYKSKDPTSDAIGTTTITFVKEPTP